MIIILLKEYRIKAAKEMIAKFIPKRKQNGLRKGYCLDLRYLYILIAESFCERKGNVRGKFENEIPHQRN